MGRMEDEEYASTVYGSRYVDNLMSSESLQAKSSSSCTEYKRVEAS